jgi:hypothetical protein
VNFSPSPAFDGLLDLAQHDGVDIRPTLLRVITDGYIQNAMPTQEDERQYAELATRLLEETDITARAAVAVRLAHHPKAPRAVVQILARDVLEVAEPILRHSCGLTPADCEAIIRECGPFHAAIIAERGRIPAASEVMVTQPDPVPEPSNSGAVELCELFFSADAPERRLILLNLDYATPQPHEAHAVPPRADIWRLEMAALRHQSEVVIRELENALGISNGQACRIVNDELGEPIVAAAKAIDMPSEVLQRVLLFLNPKIGQSVDRVYELATLHSEISADAAHRLIAIFREADAAEQTRSRRTPPAWRHAVESARRALSEISRQPAAQRARRDSSATG